MSSDHHLHDPQSQTQPQPQSSPHKPFLIEIRQERRQTNGTFLPTAALQLTEHLRTSGLLAFLSPEDLKNLLYLLTFVSPEGHCQVSLPILASAMEVSSQRVKARMHRLAQVRWQSEPLILEVLHESGLSTYSLHPLLVAYEHLTIAEPHPTTPLRAGSRAQIVTYTRQHYARPRSEVEQIVTQQLGHDPQELAESDEQRKLRTRLENVGLTTEQAREIMAMYDADVVAQQLDWLPYRNAQNPAGYLLAAIEGGYSEPRAVRQERLRREQWYQELHQEQVSPEPSTKGPLPEDGDLETSLPQFQQPQPQQDQTGHDPEVRPERQPGVAKAALPEMTGLSALDEDESIRLLPDE